MKWTIRRKLMASFSGIALFVVALGLVSYAQIDAVGELASEVARNDAIAYDVNELHRSMTAAQICQAEFMASRGEQEWLDCHAKEVDHFRKTAESVASLDRERELSEGMAEVRSSFEAYATLFTKLSQQETSRGKEGRGLVGAFRDDVHAIEEEIEAANDDSLLAGMLMLRRREKDFLLRGDVAYQEKLHKDADELRGLISRETVSAATQQKMLSLLDRYVSRFDQVVAISLEIAQTQAELTRTFETLGSEADVIEIAAQEKVEELNSRIASERSTAITTLTVFLIILLTVSVALGVVISKQFAHSASVLIAGMQRIAEGDLRTQIEIRSGDEMQDLGESANSMMRELAKMIGTLRDASSKIVQTTNDFSAATSEQSASMSEQAASVSEVGATAEEMAGVAAQVSTRARGVAQSSRDSVSTSSRGADSLNDVAQGMGDIRKQMSAIASTILDLSQKTQQVGGIIATVTDVAERSSLLALNASIEAARAGEQGKAFAVVASEVRGLAEQSQRATERVGAILRDIQHATNSAVMVTEEGNKRAERGLELVEGAQKVIAELATVIESAADSAQQIAASASQQSAGVQQISGAMRDIDGQAGENAKAIQRVDDAAKILAGLAKDLDAQVQRYVLP